MSPRRRAHATHRARSRRLVPVLVGAAALAVVAAGVDLAASAAGGQSRLLAAFDEVGSTVAEAQRQDTERLLDADGEASGAGRDGRTTAEDVAEDVAEAGDLHAVAGEPRQARTPRPAPAALRAWELRLVETAVATPWTAPLEVPPGRYLATFDLALEGAGACAFRYPGGDVAGLSHPITAGGVVTVSGTALLDTRGLAEPARLDCATGASRIADVGSRVSLVALDRVRTRSVAPMEAPAG